MPATFFDTLRNIRDGASLSEAQDMMTDLVEQVRATGRPGKLSLTITVRQAAKGNDRTLLVSDELKLTAPKTERGTTVFFATDDNELSRRDPRQPDLPGMTVVQHRPAAADGTTGKA